jgi:hypothetical protein
VRSLRSWSARSLLLLPSAAGAAYGWSRVVRGHDRRMAAMNLEVQAELEAFLGGN